MVQLEERKLYFATSLRKIALNVGKSFYILFNKRRHPLLGNGTVSMLLHHQTSRPANKHTTVEELLVAVLSLQSDLRLYNEHQCGKLVGREPVFSTWCGPFSLKRRPHFKTRKSLERAKIWSWGPIPRMTVLARGQQQFTGLELIVSRLPSIEDLSTETEEPLCDA
jgi:hypothetical protein